MSNFTYTRGMRCLSRCKKARRDRERETGKRSCAHGRARVPHRVMYICIIKVLRQRQSLMLLCICIRIQLYLLFYLRVLFIWFLLTRFFFFFRFKALVSDKHRTLENVLFHNFFPPFNLFFKFDFSFKREFVVVVVCFYCCQPLSSSMLHASYTTN